MIVERYYVLAGVDISCVERLMPGVTAERRAFYLWGEALWIKRSCTEPRGGADALFSMCIVFSMGIVNEDWGWAKRHQGQQQGPQRLKPSSQSLAPASWRQVAAGR